MGGKVSGYVHMYIYIYINIYIIYRYARLMSSLIWLNGPEFAQFGIESSLGFGVWFWGIGSYRFRLWGMGLGQTIACFLRAI